MRDAGPGAASSFLDQVSAMPQLASLLPFIRALQSIVAGSRDCALSDDPKLKYKVAAELLFLMENPGKPQ
jgi:hypothetical protein